LKFLPGHILPWGSAWEPFCTPAWERSGTEKEKGHEHLVVVVVVATAVVVYVISLESVLILHMQYLGY
jgi:hypothetical protein